VLELAHAPVEIANVVSQVEPIAQKIAHLVHCANHGGHLGSKANLALRLATIEALKVHIRFVEAPGQIRVQLLEALVRLAHLVTNRLEDFDSQVRSLHCVRISPASCERKIP
jgi:hypothetical protein